MVYSPVRLMYTSFNLAAAAYTPVRLIVRKIQYLFIEFTENVLYRDTYCYRDMSDLYRDMIFGHIAQPYFSPV